MVRTLTCISSIFFMCSWEVQAQGKISDTEGGELFFYVDATLQNPITQIEDGDMMIYAQAMLTDDMVNLADGHTQVELSLRWKGQREVYEDVRDLGDKLMKVGGSEAEVFLVSLYDERRASLFFDQVEQSENLPLDLRVELLGGKYRNTVLASGWITLDLSQGKDQYIEYILGQNLDFTFDGSDAFKDDELKVRVIADFERRLGITIHQFAWSQRDPYTGDDRNYYRRQTGGMTYSAADGACYTSGVTVFDVSPNPSVSSYQYENDGTRFNPERIPCDRVKM
ncbi:MAG: hypothetical protein AAGA85_10480 [Bacteroidota bacterium]